MSLMCNTQALFVTEHRVWELKCVQMFSSILHKHVQLIIHIDPVLNISIDRSASKYVDTIIGLRFLALTA